MAKRTSGNTRRAAKTETARAAKSKGASRSAKPARVVASGAKRVAPPLDRTPRPARGAELIVRQGFVIDATGKGPVATPEVVILGNAEGFRYLAELFTALAEQSRRAAAAPVHLPRLEHPIHARFSDDLDFRFASFNTQTRKTVLKAFGIDLKSRQEGSLFDRYQAIVTQFGRLSGIMRREGLLTPAGGGEQS